MARLTNQEIRNMSINEADAYTDAHPAEAWRFAKAHGAAAIRQVFCSLNPKQFKVYQ